MCVYLFGIHYQWLGPNFCKGNTLGDIDAIIRTMLAAGLMGLACGLTACMNHQFTMASQAWGGDSQLPEYHRLAHIKYDASVTPARYREYCRWTGRSCSFAGYSVLDEGWNPRDDHIHRLSPITRVSTSRTSRIGKMTTYILSKALVTIYNSLSKLR